jgi:drug/metabolite transporter (DMT)-like permease
MPQAIIFAVIAHLSWATVNIFNVKLTRTISPFQTVFWQTALLSILFLPIIFIRPAHVSVGIVVYTAVLAVGQYAGTLTFYMSLAKGSSQISGAITSTTPIFITLLSILFLHATIPPVALLAAGIVTVGLVIIAWPDKQASIDASVGYACLTVLFWAVYFAFISRSVNEIGAYWTNYLTVIAGVISLLIYAFFRKGSRNYRIPIARKSLPLLCVSAVFTGGATLAYFTALKHASPAVVAPIAGSYAALFIVASSLIYKDRVSRRQWLGILVTVGSVFWFVLLTA